jgi:hypothetical protein
MMHRNSGFEVKLTARLRETKQRSNAQIFRIDAIFAPSCVGISMGRVDDGYVQLCRPNGSRGLKPRFD